MYVQFGSRTVFISIATRVRSFSTSNTTGKRRFCIMDTFDKTLKLEEIFFIFFIREIFEGKIRKFNRKILPPFSTYSNIKNFTYDDLL